MPNGFVAGITSTMEDTPLIVSPSILSADFAHIAEEVGSIGTTAAKWIHLDVMDGNFVPNITFGSKFIKDLRPCSPLVFDTHLMIDKPERYVEQFAQSGCDIITIQAESTIHVHRTLQMIHSNGCKAGIAIVPSTPVCMIEPVLDMVDLVLVMTVNPGFGGQKLIPHTLDKVSELAHIRQEEEYSYLISVDGGVNLSTVEDIAAAGSDVAVCGSAFFGAEDRFAFVEKMIRLAEGACRS